MADSLLQNVYDTVRHDFTDPIPADHQIPGSSILASDKALVNCFTISATGPGGKEPYIHKRPGILPSGVDFNSILGNVNSMAVANAVMTSLNDVYVAAVYDWTNSKHVIIQYRPITGTTTKVGEITSTTTNDDVFLSELTIANVCTLGVVWNKADGTASKGYYATSGASGFSASSLTEITDTDFPPKRGTPLPLVGPMVQMNGTTYVLTNTGEIVGSDINSITAWTSTNTVQAISYPDQGVGLCRYKGHILAFGEDSIEFFNDVGGATTPLARAENAFIKFGALTARAILAVDDTVYWIAKSGSGTCGLYRLNGYAPEKLSTPREDYALSYMASNYPTLNTGIMSAITMMGCKHISIGGSSFLPALATADPISGLITNSQMMYNINENEFWIWEANQTNREAILGVSQYQLNNQSPDDQYLLLTPANGIGTGARTQRYYTVYALGQGENQQFSDQYGATATAGGYNMIVQTNKLWWGTEKRKRIHKWKAILDTMYSTVADATLTFGYVKGVFDNFYHTTITTRDVTLPNTAQRYYISNLGQSRVWQFLLYTDAEGPIRLRAFEFDISQAAH